MFKVFNSYSIDHEGSTTINAIRESLYNCNSYFTDESLFVFKTSKINFILSARYNNEDNFTPVRYRAISKEICDYIIIDAQMLTYIYPNKINKETFLSRMRSILVSLIYSYEVDYISIEVTNDPMEAYNSFTSKTISMGCVDIVDRVNTSKLEREEINAIAIDSGCKFTRNQFLNFLDSHNLNEEDYYSISIQANTEIEENSVVLPEGCKFEFDVVKASQEMGDMNAYFSKEGNIVIETSDMKMTHYTFTPSKYSKLRLL